MENASKALLMTASILISVVLISLATYLFFTFSDYSKEVNTNLSSRQKQEFNNKFTKYSTAETEDLCTAYDIVTIINMAHNSNEQYEEFKGQARPADFENDSNAYIYVNVNSDKNITEVSSTSDLNEFINAKNATTTIKDSKDETKMIYKFQYVCEVILSEKTGLAKTITFIENEF